MCGIVGLVGFPDTHALATMNRLIAHRGPDDQDEFRDPEAEFAFAMRRLSIIDLESGHQPMSNEDGTIWIICNGEIYNAPELRAHLERQGHRFATNNSDVEVLVHLYEEKGPDLLYAINGMYAFVIYDQRRQLLFGARDRMGIKPLYYWKDGNRFAFASELKALLVLPEVKRQINFQSLYHYLTLLYVPGEASMIQDVYRLPPAHYFTYDLRERRLAQECYWSLDFRQECHYDEAEWAEKLRVELRQAVKRWTLSDVPIACSLSGGLDSSAVVGLLAEMGYPKFKTYTLGFIGPHEQAWDERGRARQVAERWGTDHREINLHPDELLEDLVAMVWYLDEPYGGGLPSWYVFREMGREVKVALTGSGGDELFGNYGKFAIYEQNPALRTTLALRGFSKAVLDALGGMSRPFAWMANQLPSAWRVIGQGRAVSQLPAMLREPFGHYYYANAFYLSDADKRDAVLQKAGQMKNTSTYLQELYDKLRVGSVRNNLAAVDFRTQLAEEFLLMTDRFSMAHALEARVPLLDHKLVETVYRIPPGIRTRVGDLKYLFKRAVGDLLPPGLIDAPKSGFVIPVELWLRGALRPLVEHLLHPERLKQQGIFQPRLYERWVRPHLAGQANFTWQIWAMVMFQLWHVVYIEQDCHHVPGFGWKDLLK